MYTFWGTCRLTLAPRTEFIIALQCQLYGIISDHLRPRRLLYILQLTTHPRITHHISPWRHHLQRQITRRRYLAHNADQQQRCTTADRSVVPLGTHRHSLPARLGDSNARDGTLSDWQSAMTSLGSKRRTARLDQPKPCVCPIVSAHSGLMAQPAKLALVFWSRRVF